MNQDLDNVLVVEKLMDVEAVANPVNTVLLGPVQKSLFRYDASSQSNNSLIFNNITAPSLTTVMQRSLKIAMQAKVVVTCAGNNVVGTDFQMHAINQIPGSGDFGEVVVLEGGVTNANLCLRACPLQSVCSSLDVRLNGASTNVAINNYACIYPFLQGKEDINRYAGSMPFQPDNAPTYENASPTNPFGGLKSNSSVQTRGSFIAELISSAGTPLVRTYRIRWVEELLISPFMTGHNKEDVGLVNVNNLTVTLRLDSIANMFSSTATTGGYVVSLLTSDVDPAALLVQFNSQNSILAMRSPQTAIYPYHQMQVYQAPISSLAGTFVMPSLRLSCQPSKIFLFIAPIPSARTAAIPDHFLSITNVSVNFNDKNSLLNTFTQADLYEMSAFNAGSQRGGFMTYNSFRYGSGSIIIIDVQRDLSVAESSQGGTQNSYSTFQATIQYNNNNCLFAATPQQLAVTSYNAFQLISSPGKAYVSPSQCEFSVSGVSPEVVLALTANDDTVKVPEDGAGDGEGVEGKGFSDLVSRGVKMLYDNRAVILPHVKKLLGGDISGGQVSAGALRHKRA